MRDAESIPVPIDRGRLERCARELALVVAAGRMSERAFLAATRRLNSEDARLVEHARPSVGIDTAKAIDYIRNFASSWAKAPFPIAAYLRENGMAGYPSTIMPRHGANSAD